MTRENDTAAWAEMYAEAEKLWTGPVQEFIGSEFFVRWLETGRDAYLAQVELSRDSLEQYWDAVRLPHKGDLTRMAGHLVSVEEKVDALDERLDGIHAGLASIGPKIGALLARLESAMARLDAPAERKGASR